MKKTVSLLVLLAWALPAQASTITDPGVIILLQDGNATINWNAAVTGPVAIEHSTDLSDWTEISPMETSGFFTDAIRPANKGFYRLKFLQPETDGMITVQGGRLQTTNSLDGTVVSPFRIGKYEVRWDEWQELRSWALSNGYDFFPGRGSDADHPVRNVNWFDAVKYCNALSERDGLSPVYLVSGATYRTGQTIPTVNQTANGYRLPKEAEWEWAARGGTRSQDYTYSGSDDVNLVAWYVDNSSGAALNLSNSRGTWPVGQKTANELGIHDMSGNVWEWVFDGSFSSRIVRGGSWINSAALCSLAYRVNIFSDIAGNSHVIGFRLARNWDPSNP
jgi:formylglycine-generating enzyme